MYTVIQNMAYKIVNQQNCKPAYSTYMYACIIRTCTCIHRYCQIKTPIQGIPHPKNNSQQSHIIRSRLFKNKGSGDILKLHV